MREIKELVESLFRKGSFIQNVGFTSSSKIIVLTLSFMFVPILSRLYHPQAYGNFALYSSITSIAAIFTLMGYPNAYVLIKEDKRFESLMIFQLLAIIVISIASIIPISLSFYFGYAQNLLLWFIPAGILINGFIVIFSNWMIRYKEFNVSALLESSGELLIRLVNLLIGYLWAGFQYGLVIGNMSGRSIVNSISLIRFLKKGGPKKVRSLKSGAIREVLIEWSEYPKYILPHQLIQQFGSQAPVYFLAAFFGNKELGYFSMAMTLFSIPVQLFSNAIAPVYLQKANELREESLFTLREFSKRLLQYSQILIFIPLLVLSIFSEDIVPFFLGDKWEPTAILISIIVLYIFFDILLTPLSPIFQVLRKEKLLVMFNIISLFVIFFCLLIAVIFELPFYPAILLYAGAKAGTGIMRGILICKLLKLSFVKLVGATYSLLLVLALINYLSRYLMYRPI